MSKRGPMDAGPSNSSSNTSSKKSNKKRKWPNYQKRRESNIKTKAATPPVHSSSHPVQGYNAAPSTSNASSFPSTNVESPIRTYKEFINDLLLPNKNCEKYDYWHRLFTELVEIPYTLAYHRINFLMRRNERCSKEKRFRCSVCYAFFGQLEDVNRHIKDSVHLSKLQKMKLSATCELAPELPISIKDMLNVHLENICKNHGLSIDDLEQREKISKDINNIIIEHLPGFSINTFGSTYHGMGLKTSDLNMGLITDCQIEPAFALVKLADIMSKSTRVYNLDTNINEGVPNLVFNFDSPDSVLCNITVNNELSNGLSRLLLFYSMYDSRLKKLCILMRLWGKICKLDDKDDHFFKPFTLYLLVVNYLLHHHKLLPFIHETLLENFKSPDFKVTPKLIDFRSEDNTPLCELWRELFAYYSSDSKGHRIVYITQEQPNFKKMFLAKNRFLIFDPFTSRPISGFYNSNCQQYILHCFNQTKYYYSVPHTKEGPIFGFINIQLYPDDQSMLQLSEFFANQCTINTCLVKLIPFYDSNYHEINEEEKKQLLELIRTNNRGRLFINSSHVNGDLFAFYNSERAPPFQNKYRTLIVRPSEAQYLIEKLDHSKIYYNFNWESFTSEKNAPKCCSLCFKDDHAKSQCPEIVLPPLEVLPEIDTNLQLTLNQLCEEVYVAHLPTQKDIDLRNEIVSDIEFFLTRAYPSARLSLFGSSKNGFGLKDSDLDISLYVEDDQIAIDKSWTEKVQVVIKRCPRLKKIFSIPSAKVPIIKFLHGPTFLEGDISWYNTLAQENTALLKIYSEVDARVKKLAIMLKRFTKLANIGDASKGSLSSYSYTIMLIYYLQQCSPPVLPVLHEIKSENPEDLKILQEFDCQYFTAIDKLPHIWSDYGKNNMNVGELWINMLRFYTEVFNFEDIVISISTQQQVSKFRKLWLYKKIAIEDPFNKQIISGSLSRKMNIIIMKAFRKARIHFSTLPPPSSNKSLENYYFDDNILAEKDTPDERVCYICKSDSHLSKVCHLKLDSKTENKIGLNIFKNVNFDFFHLGDKCIVGSAIQSINNSSITMKVFCPLSSLPYFNFNYDIGSENIKNVKSNSSLSTFKGKIGLLKRYYSPEIVFPKKSGTPKSTDFPSIQDTYKELKHLLKLLNYK